jgi:hypothetical protein
MRPSTFFGRARPSIRTKLPIPVLLWISLNTVFFFHHTQRALTVPCLFILLAFSPFRASFCLSFSFFLLSCSQAVAACLEDNLFQKKKKKVCFVEISHFECRFSQFPGIAFVVIFGEYSSWTLFPLCFLLYANSDRGKNLWCTLLIRCSLPHRQSTCTSTIMIDKVNYTNLCQFNIHNIVLVRLSF